MNIYNNNDTRWKIENKNNEQSRIIDSYRNQLFDYHNQYTYQWFCTLNLRKYDVEDCEKLLKMWRDKMSIQDHIQISYTGVIVTSPSTGHHVHLLMMGKNEDDETLLDRNMKDWEREWDYIVTHPLSSRYTDKEIQENRFNWERKWKKPDYSKIELVLTEPVIGYVSCFKNTPIDNFELVKPYNKKLLSKSRKNN